MMALRAFDEGCGNTEKSVQHRLLNTHQVCFCLLTQLVSPKSEDRETVHVHAQLITALNESTSVFNETLLFLMLKTKMLLNHYDKK